MFAYKCMAGLEATEAADQARRELQGMRDSCKPMAVEGAGGNVDGWGDVFHPALYWDTDVAAPGVLDRRHKDYMAEALGLWRKD